MSNLYYIQSDHSEENKLMKYASQYELICEKGQYVCLINEKVFKEGVIDSYHILDKTLVFKDCVLSNVKINLIEKVEKIIFDNCVLNNVIIDNKKPINALIVSSTIKGYLIFNFLIKKNNNKITFENVFLNRLNNKTFSVFQTNNIFNSFQTIHINNCTNFIFYSSYILPDNHIFIHKSKFHIYLDSKDFLTFYNNVNFINNNIINCNFTKRFKENLLEQIDYNNISWLFKVEKVQSIVNYHKGETNFIIFFEYFLNRVYVESIYDISISQDDKVQIGCKDKEIKDWDYFFSNECIDCYETSRSHPLFQIIKKNYQIFKIKNNL